MARRSLLLSGFVPALVAALVLCAAALAALWHDGIRQDVERLRGERFRFSLLQVKSALEAGLRLGNAVNEMGGTPALIARVRDHQPDILSVDVYDTQGAVVFSTDPGGLGLAIPAEWTSACLQARGTAPWSGRDVDGGVLCVGLVNPFGQPAGGVLLRHRGADRADEGLTLSADWAAVLGAVAAGSLLVMALAAWLLRPLERAAQSLHAHIEARGGAAPDTVLVEPALLEQALRALRQQEAALAVADAEADRLDQQEGL